MGKLKEDLRAYSGGQIGKAVLTVLLDGNFKAMKNYRLAHFLYEKMHMRLLPILLHRHNRKKYAIDIDYRCKIDGGFRIAHGTGIVIGKDVRIGKNVSLYQGVTLGGNIGKHKLKDGVEFTQPWIGDNVTLYAHSMLIGPVYVGDNSVIGAGSVVMKDVPADSVCFTKNEIVIKPKGENAK